MARDFFYDGQIRRFVTQFMRMLSNIQVEFGKDRNNVIALQRVPVYYGDSSRQVASILKNNSENTLSAVPAIAVYISGLAYDRERVQDPSMVSTVRLRERKYDPVTGEYSNQQGDIVQVDRPMPVPYKLTLKADIWTSNTEQKLQLVEQLVVLFNPSMEIQSSDNYVDWTSLTVVTLTDNNWSSRSVPVGAEEPIDIATMTFEIPIWISAPAAVKKYGAIERMITNIFDGSGSGGSGGAVGSDGFARQGTSGSGSTPGSTAYQNYMNDIMDNNKQMTRTAFSPMHYKVLYTGNTLVLLKHEDLDRSTTSIGNIQSGSVKIGSPDSWPALFDTFGEVKNGISTIKLLTATGSEIVGTFAVHPSDNTQVLYTPFVDTLPANTLDPVDAIIDPLNVAVNSSLLNPDTGTRYLILDDIGSYTNTQPSVVWRGPDNQNFVAHANDIIEYNGSGWIVSLNSQLTESIEYVTNLTTGIQYRWQSGEWAKSVEGVYNETEWTIIL
jgi:hypothetical protein